jgi:DNA processing protein
MIAPLGEEVAYLLALTQVEFIGCRMARTLLDTFGSASAIFQAPTKHLASIEGMGAKRVLAIKRGAGLKNAEQELRFMEKRGIRLLTFLDEYYPRRLLNCADAPLVLYYKGGINLNAEKVVAIVGTRKNTEYGKRITESLVEGLQGQNITIVSGLAFGIDIIAHRKALSAGLPTIGVVAHGLDIVYPAEHRHVVEEMLNQGGVLTEYPSGTRPDKQNFPMRNRIVAGISDAVVVVETEVRGGAMITAKLAVGYDRDVAAFPGRTIDTKSSGCNYLIATNMAQMITGSEDLLSMMNWESNNQKPPVQTKLFPQFTGAEALVVELLTASNGMHIDELMLKVGMGSSSLASALLVLEMEGYIKSMPGKMYKLI